MSLAGRDRTGIVKTFTKAVVEHKANVQESKMAILGGDFAMIVFITMENAGDADNLAKYLQKELPDYLVTTRNTTPPPENKGEAQGLWSLLVEAPDQPGIVAALSQALATHGANVHQLDTELTTAPFAGYTTFKIMGKVALSEDHLDEISTALNKLEDSFGASIILNQIEA